MGRGTPITYMELLNEAAETAFGEGHFQPSVFAGTCFATPYDMERFEWRGIMGPCVEFDFAPGNRPVVRVATKYVVFVLRRDMRLEPGEIRLEPLDLKGTGVLL